MLAGPARGQELQKPAKPPRPPATFFDSETPLVVTLAGDLETLRDDKDANSPWRLATLSYTSTEAKAVIVPLRVKTRGIWRLKSCDFPPVRLNFNREATAGTVFEGLDKPKLVSYCRNTDSYEQHVLQELQLYRIYQLLTPAGHKARLLHVAYTDSVKRKILATRYAVLLEDPDAIAARLGGTILEQEGARAGDLDPFYNALVGVFEYFIGNTDFSINRLHNIKLLFKPDGTVLPFAFDFDFSGAVNAPYATVDPRYSVTRVRDRLFLGSCTEGDAFSRVFELFNDRQPQIYALYGDSIGMLLNRRIAKETLRYFDEFYLTINDSTSARSKILKACIDRHP